MAAVSGRRRWAAAVAVGVLTALLTPPVPVFADSVSDGQWYVGFLRLPQAHEITQGKGVVVGLIDTGVGQHPDLTGNVSPGADVLFGKDPDGRNDMQGHGTS